MVMFYISDSFVDSVMFDLIGDVGVELLCFGGNEYVY